MLSFRARSSVLPASKPRVLATPTLPSDFTFAHVPQHQRSSEHLSLLRQSVHLGSRGQKPRWPYPCTVTKPSRRHCAHGAAPLQTPRPTSHPQDIIVKKIRKLFGSLSAAQRSACSLCSTVVPQPLMLCMSMCRLPPVPLCRCSTALPIQEHLMLKAPPSPREPKRAPAGPLT